MSETRQEAAGRTTRPRHPDRPCLNCGDPTVGEFCPRCGQQKVDVQVSMREMVVDLLEDELLLGRRLPHTLLALLFRPGFLTAEVLRGRIVRYVRPFKLYLATSVVFFLVLSFVSLRAIGGDGLEVRQSVDGADPAAMSLPALDSAIAVLDQQLAAPDLSAARAMGLAAARSAFEQQRARLLAAGDSAGVEAPEGAGEDAVQDERWLRVDNIDIGIPRVDSVLTERAQRLGEMEPGEAGQEIARTFLGYAPGLMFVLLPAFAAFLKLLYVRQGRFYAEHMIFVLHTHAFIFLIFTLMLLTRSWIGGWPLALLLLWIGVYIYLAMRRVYQQSHFVTLVKYWTLGWLYFWLLLGGSLVALVASILFLPA